MKLLCHSKWSASLLFLIVFFFFWMYTFGVCSYIYSSPACFSLSPLPLHPLFRHLDDSILLKNSNNNNKRVKKKKANSMPRSVLCRKKKKVDGKGNNVVFGYAEMRCARCWTAIATVVLPSSFIIVIHGDSKTQEKKGKVKKKKRKWISSANGQQGGQGKRSSSHLLQNRWNTCARKALRKGAKRCFSSFCWRFSFWQ